jgi:hypothetical protein
MGIYFYAKSDYINFCYFSPLKLAKSFYTVWAEIKTVLSIWFTRDKNKEILA